MAAEIITKEDLQQFKIELLQDIKDLLIPKIETHTAWLRSGQVRKLLNISPGTLQILRIKGTLRSSKVGKIFYYKHEDIISLLEGKSK